MVIPSINNWIKVYRDTIPHSNLRLNNLILDARSNFDPRLPLPSILDAIDKLTKDYPPPYNLYCSGGVDSQFMIWAWLQSGIKFNIIHIDYFSQNLHDTNTLTEFCNKCGVKYEIRKFDVIKFLDSVEYLSLAKRYDCASPHILTYIKMISADSATCVMAGNYIDLFGCGVNYTIHGLQRYAQKDKNNFIPFFLLYTPELAYSFLDIDSTFAAKHNIGYLDYSVKCNQYSLVGAPIVPQEKKFTGFENIKLLYDNTPVPFITKLRWYNKPSRRPFDLIYRYSLLDLITDYTDRTTCLRNFTQ